VGGRLLPCTKAAAKEAGEERNEEKFGVNCKVGLYLEDHPI